MVDQEFDAEDAEANNESATADAINIIGDDVFSLLADASQKYDVVISVHIAPRAPVDDSNDE